MSYQQFAYLYDQLMEDVHYNLWIDFINRKIKQHSARSVNKILDLACGTGELSIHLAKAGYHVVGIDLSEDMLSVAHAKATEANQRISFYQQDMTEIEPFDRFEVVVIFCDSLNYLKTPEDVQATFENVYKLLDSDGIFMFDVHSIYKMNEIFMNQTFTSSDDEVSFIWNSFPGGFPNSVEHELSFFVLDNEQGLYHRIDEIHYQRTYSPQDYQQWLNNAGFEIIDIDADFTNKVNKKSERIFFTARKRTE